METVNSSVSDSTWLDLYQSGRTARGFRSARRGGELRRQLAVGPGKGEVGQGSGRDPPDGLPFAGHRVGPGQVGPEEVDHDVSAGLLDRVVRVESGLGQLAVADAVDGDLAAAERPPPALG